MTGLRSSNRTTPRKRYTVDAFEGIEALVSDTSSSGEDIPDDPGDGQDEDDFEAAELSESDDDDAMSGVEHEENEASERGSNAGELNLEENVSIASDPDVPKSKPSRKAKRLAVPEEVRLYTRGTPDHNVHNALTKKERRKFFFGPSRGDQEIVMKARAIWGTETCFPSRKANKSGIGGLAYSVPYETAISNAEAHWKWYSLESGMENFSKRQQANAMTEAEAEEYTPVNTPSEQSVVMGAVNQQKLYILSARCHIPLHEPFEREPEPGQNWKEVRPTEYKSGFLLNLGARVHCLDWAPNQHERNQYLAVTMLPKRPPEEEPGAPAFTPHPQHLSSIQIWRITATDSGHVDKSVSPRPAMVFGGEIGDIRGLKWCPVPRPDSDRLGLLAFISYDGSLRVLDIDRPSGDLPSYRELDTFAFESKPPSTVCTCLAWIDSHRIAAGCANGCVAIWNLADCLASSSSNPRPTSYVSLAPSYIHTITTAWPSFPEMLMMTSVSGHTTLTDLSRPFVNPCATAEAGRVRVGHNTLAWIEHAKSAITVEDNLTVRTYPLRRWFSTIGVGKVKNMPTCIATSPCHPFVLIGTTGGEVTGVSPLRRIIDGGKVTLWQQEWFRHEWRRPTPEEKNAAENLDSEIMPMEVEPNATREQVALSNDETKARLGKTGLTRISEGFKAEKIALDGKSAPNTKNGVLFKTIHEENSAITALAWNPNLHVGGWAAAGMANGLLRIEDLAT